MPNLAHSRKQDPARGAKREKNIREILDGDGKKIPGAGWLSIKAPRQLTIIDKGITHIYRSRVMDFWRAFDSLSIRPRSPILAVQSSTITNFTHKMEQVEASVLWPLLTDPTSELSQHMLAQIWVWGHRVQDVGPDGNRIPPPGWHYRIYEIDTTITEGHKWRRVAACDSKGRVIEGWPRPAVLEPLTFTLTIPPEAYAAVGGSG